MIEKRRSSYRSLFALTRAVYAARSGAANFVQEIAKFSPVSRGRERERERERERAIENNREDRVIHRSKDGFSEKEEKKICQSQW